MRRGIAVHRSTYPLILIAFLGNLAIISAATKDAPTKAQTTPISDWESSFAASSLGSSVVALKCRLKVRSRKESPAVLVVLSKSNNKDEGSSSYHLEAEDDEYYGPLELDSHGVLPIRSLSTSMLQDPQVSTFPNAALFMTGLAPDVAYLQEVVHAEADANQVIYERSHEISSYSLVETLARKLRQRTHDDDTPFAIQGLVVGGSKNGHLQIHTLDPSGGVRSWPMATVIGKDAVDLRGSLYKELVDMVQEQEDGIDMPPLTLRQAGKVVVEVLCCQPDAKVDELKLSKLQAMLIWSDKSSRSSLLCSRLLHPSILASFASQIRR